MTKDVNLAQLGIDMTFLLRNYLTQEQVSSLEIDLLGSLVGYKIFDDKQIIQPEGSGDDTLFFLIEGQVEVFQQNEWIALISVPGEVLSEMDLAPEKVSSVSQYARGSCTFLTLKAKDVNQLPQHLHVAFTHALNRMFHHLLSEKFTKAQERAQSSETANQELVLAKRALEAASLSRILDLNANQRSLLVRLNCVLNQGLPKIQGHAMQLAVQLGTENGVVKQLTSELETISSEFASLASQLDRETDLKNVNVLILESEVDEQINSKISLIGTDLQFTMIPDVESAKRALPDGAYDIICMTEPFLELLSSAKQFNPAAKLVFMTSKSVSEHFDTLKNYPEFSTILARHPEDRSFTMKSIATTLRKLASADIFGMDKYLSLGTVISEQIVTGSEQRPLILAKLEEYSRSINIRAALRGKVLRVAEEILMNCIYDAPIDEKGKPKYNHLQRTEVVSLAPAEYGRFRFACDGSCLAISVEDPFGRLDRSIIVQSLERWMSGDAPEVDIEGKGGGGNGLFQIIQSCSLTVFNVAPNQKTEVIALFNLNYQVQKIGLHPSFQFFEWAPL